jgi:hypothetical protein
VRRFVPLMVSVAGLFVGWMSLHATEPASKTPHAEEWGTIKGQIVFGGDKVPAAEPLKVDKDQEHCLQKGTVLSRTWTVNPQNKGVCNAVVFLKPEPGQTLPINPEALPKKDSVVIDQPICHFEPHILALYKDQKLMAKNSSPIAHNIVITGFKNSYNTQLAPGTDRTFELVSENNPIALSCGAHSWMKGNLWVFAHPYFAVTDANGNFEIKFAPAGNQNFVVWHEAKGYACGRNGKKITVPAGSAVDVGKIELMP